MFNVYLYLFKNKTQPKFNYIKDLKSFESFELQNLHLCIQFLIPNFFMTSATQMFVRLFELFCCRLIEKRETYFIFVKYLLKIKLLLNFSSN